MRENEFEKRVQQKMEGFDLSPSPEVWVEVEQRIRKEKKRRFVFWWFVLFLGIGGGTAIIFLTGKKKETTEIAVNDKAKARVSGVIEKTNLPVPAISSDSTIDPSSINNKIETNNSTVSDPTMEIPTTTAPIVKKKTRKTFITKDEVIQSSPNSAGETKTISRPDIDTLATTDVIQTTETVTQTTVDPSLIVGSLPAPQKEDSISTTKLGEKKMDTVAIAENNDKKDKKTKKWGWGISASAGRSAIVNGLHLFEPVNYSSALLSGGSPVAGLADYRNTRANGSGAGSVGLFATRSLSKKWDIRVGLDYNYLSSKMPVGLKVDSTRIINAGNANTVQVSNFYRAGNASTYTNRFHLLTLSAEAGWGIIDGKKFKLRWENGIAYSRLLGSNMLHFNAGIIGFYKDNSLLTKDQFSFSTGFSWPVSHKLSINPYASYSITTVLKDSNADNSNFFQYGIRLRFLLNKK